MHIFKNNNAYMSIQKEMMLGVPFKANNHYLAENRESHQLRA